MKFKIRASAAGKIAGAKGLGVTGQKYVENWYKGKLMKRHVEIKSKYLEKGNIMEDDSLDIVAKKLNLGLLLKNEQHYEDEWMTGTPDAVLPDMIIDVKNSWSWETFPLIAKEVPNKDYYWQLQCYMALTERSAAKLIYTLQDTPRHLIEREAHWYCVNNGYGDYDEDILQKFMQKMTYQDLPEEYKYKEFDIKRNEEDISFLRNRVVECRKYLETIKI